jgi:hypothetical protein
MRTASFILTTAAVVALAACGSGTPSQPNPSTTPIPITPPPSSPPPTGIVLPPGMVCDPTPPPLHGFKVSVHDYDAASGRTILDSKPLVENVDNYCDRTHQGGGKFCATRVETDPQATACDYLMTGIAPSTGRWGPSWTFNGKPCGTVDTDETFTSCANHQHNQFMAIGKTTGKFEACASPEVPVFPGQGRCGSYNMK